MNKKLLIGSDPELIIYDDRDQLVPADEFSKQFGLNYTRDSEIGIDGHAATLELRPKPKPCPLLHYKEIQKLLKRLSSTVPVGWELRGGSKHGNKEIGGHIHFNINPNDNMTRALNFYLACPTLLLESKEEARSRRQRYGRLDKEIIREKAWGFEYRPLASWLIDEKITKGILCLAYVIASEYRDNKKVFHKKQHDMLISFEEYHACNKAFFQKYIKLIINGIVCMKLYPKYKNEINTVLGMIKSNIEGWDEKTDIIKAWGLKDAEELKTRLFMTKGKNLKFIEDGIIIKQDGTGQQICIYGLSKNRGEGYDLMVSTPTMKKIIQKKYKELNIDIASIGVATKHKYAIGFSYPMRTETDENNRALKHLCIEILQHVINSFNEIINTEKTINRNGRRLTRQDVNAVERAIY